MNEPPSERGSPAFRAARDLAGGIDRITLAWPDEERHGGLADQIRAKAVAVSAGILLALDAETPAERLDHLAAANGARAAVETRLLISQHLAYADESTCTELLDLSADLARLLLHDEIDATRKS